MEEEIEDVDSTTDEIVDLDTDTQDEQEDIEAIKAKNETLYARAKKAEEELKKLKSQPKPEAKEVKSDNGSNEEVIKRILEQQALEDLELEDDLKKEVEKVSKLQGISVKKAMNDPYITFLKDQKAKQNREEEASVGSKGRAAVKKDLSNANPEDFDLTTPEGRAEYDKYTEHLKKQLG